MDFFPPHLQKNVAGLDPGTGRRRAVHDLRHFRTRTFRRRGGLGNINPDPTMPGFAEADKIAADFLGRFDWHRITRRIVFKAADQDADNLAFHVQERCAGLSPLCRKIDPQVRGRKITAEVFPIKSCDHSEIRRFRQIQWITNRDDGGCDSQLLGFPNRQRRRCDIRL